MHTQIIALLAAVALTAACASSPPPKPPSVDGKHRTPINGPAATRLLSIMATPVPEEVSDPPRQFTREPDPSLFVRLGRDGTVSRVIHVPFQYAGVIFRPTPEQRYRLRRLSTVASRVEVRGRTDSRGGTEANRMLAMQRAMSAKQYLIGLGMPAERIAVTYLSKGDPIGDESTKEGRAKNRRAEIEFFIAPEARS